MEQVVYGFRYSASGCQTLIEVPAKEAKAFFEAGPDARPDVRALPRKHRSPMGEKRVHPRNGAVHR